MLTRSLLVIALCVLVGYGFIEAYPLIAGPSLSVESPADFGVISSGNVEILGTVRRASTLTLNGAPLLATADGSFATSFTYPRGDTILTFIATDRFGRSRTITRTISVP